MSRITSQLNHKSIEATTRRPHAIIRIAIRNHDGRYREGISLDPHEARNIAGLIYRAANAMDNLRHKQRAEGLAAFTRDQTQPEHQPTARTLPSKLGSF